MIVCAGSMSLHSSDIRYKCKRAVAKSATDHRSGIRYVLKMKIAPVNQWVADIIDRSKIGQAGMSRELSKVLRRNIDRAAVNKMASGERAVAADEMLAMETISKISIPSAYSSMQVPVLEWVQAGKLAEPRSQIPAEDVPLLAFADLGKGEFFGLTVKGSSMDRISPEGSIIIVNRQDKTLVNGRCYVFSVRGETTYKRWHGGSTPYLAPYSTDPIHQPIMVGKKKDLEVIGRVKRTVLDL